MATPYTVNSNGNPTIGYGHEIKDGKNYTNITKEKAESLLAEDLKNV
jgi:hypothetical protein